MGLNKLTDRIYFMDHNPKVDRPMLAYLKGDKFSLVIDAGYSAMHVHDFYKAIEAEKFDKPDFTVITHWHYDHTFGMHAINGVSIAHERRLYCEIPYVRSQYTDLNLHRVCQIYSLR